MTTAASRLGPSRTLAAVLATGPAGVDGIVGAVVWVGTGVGGGCVAVGGGGVAVGDGVRVGNGVAVAGSVGAAVAASSATLAAARCASAETGVSVAAGTVTGARVTGTAVGVVCVAVRGARLARAPQATSTTISPAPHFSVRSRQPGGFLADDVELAGVVLGRRPALAGLALLALCWLRRALAGRSGLRLQKVQPTGFSSPRLSGGW